MSSAAARVATGARQPKAIGSDTELGNVLMDSQVRLENSGWRAAWALLGAVDGLRDETARHVAAAPYANVRDIGRKYLASNGSCCYVDLGHFEICTPETASARDFTAAWQALLRISQKALADANGLLPDGCALEVTVNNSDGNGASWGGHLSFLLSRQLFDALCVWPRLVPFGYLAGFQASSIVYAGAGKVGAENGRAGVAFQIAQRADFMERLIGPETTVQRPLINTRDEALCGERAGGRGDQARLHVIFYDTTLAPVATFLKAGVLQLVLAMLERGGVSSRHHLQWPLRALHAWSHDPDLRARARTVDGRHVTALEHQFLVLEDLRLFVDSGEAEAYVPGAARIVALWEDTLTKLHARDWSGLAGRLDWVARRMLIDSVLARNGLEWDSAEAKHLDLLFANLDPAKGLHWALQRDGHIEQIATEAKIVKLMSSPPENTRAWARTMLLRRAGQAALDRIDWDRVRVRLPGPAPAYRTVMFPDPMAHTRAATGEVFAAYADLPELVHALGGRQSAWAGTTALDDAHLPVLSPGQVH